MTENQNYTAISLFSGMGGDTLGMEKAGLNVIGYVEYVNDFIQTHNKNFSNCKLIGEKVKGNITKITDEEFERYKGVDFLFAGFPCQSFSTGGKRKINDPRNTMFKEFVRCAKNTEAKVIIGENVKGLLTKKTEDNNLYIDVIKKEFEDLGYIIKYKVFKCVKYGVPQKRERLIILGIKQEFLNTKFKLEFPEEKDTENNLEHIIKFGMKGALKFSQEQYDFSQIPEEYILTDLNNDEQENNPHPYLKMKRDLENKSYKEKEYNTLFSFQKRDSPIHCEIINIKKPSKTIICTYEHQPRLFVPLRNKNGYYLRMLFPDELKQIQSFPANFEIVGNDKNKIIQIGNAVPPLLIEKIIRKIIDI